MLPRSALGTEAERATYHALHTAALAAPALREGLTGPSAERSIRHLRTLLATPTAVLADRDGILAWDGPGQHHGDQVCLLAAEVAATDATIVGARRSMSCDTPGCTIRQAVAAPLRIEAEVVGSLLVAAPHASAHLVRATEEVANWISGQLDLAELDASRRRLMEAEVRALRAQISPHFIYNSLGAIASFVRTDPERARELLLEFADFTRYSFRRHGDFTTLADELRSIQQYLLLEEARFGDRLRVTLRIAPEVLPVTIPYLCLQPLVENAIQHGLESREGAGTIEIIARDLDRECEISIEDDGVGEDPDRVRAALAGGTDSVGLGNVDERLRRTLGDEYGLVVETAPGAGTKVTVRVPKYAPGVQP